MECELDRSGQLIYRRADGRPDEPRDTQPANARAPRVTDHTWRARAPPVYFRHVRAARVVAGGRAAARPSRRAHVGPAGSAGRGRGDGPGAGRGGGGGGFAWREHVACPSRLSKARARLTWRGAGCRCRAALAGRCVQCSGVCVGQAAGSVLFFGHVFPAAQAWSAAHAWVNWRRRGSRMSLSVWFGVYQRGIAEDASDLGCGSEETSVTARVVT
jgi:hypothetical protein